MLKVECLMFRDMKRCIFSLALALVALVASAQIKKPELMVIPSDVWCINNGYYTEVENMGITAKVPNYKQALQENMGLKLAIAKLNDLMAERQFPLQSLEQTIKNLEQRRMEDNMMKCFLSLKRFPSSESYLSWKNYPFSEWYPS